MHIRRAALALALALLSTSVFARVEVTLDAETLNEMLTKMAPDKVDVNLAAGRSLTLHLRDMKVTGFDPAAGPNGGVNTSLRLVVPDLGIDIPVTPHLTLDMKAGANGKKTAALRFDKVVLNLPLTGAIDVASLLPILPIMPETAWTVDSARGRVRVRPDLIDAKTGVKNIRLAFDLAVSQVDPAASASR
jgi:hypothetical protein